MGSPGETTGIVERERPGSDGATNWNREGWSRASAAVFTTAVPSELRFDILLLAHAVRGAVLARDGILKILFSVYVMKS
jgi:hypothetical protein